MDIARAEMIERIRIQASLAEKMMIALLVLNAGGAAMYERLSFQVGCITGLLAFAAAFMSQHFFVLACQHGLAGEHGRERQCVIAGNICYAPGVFLALAGIIAFAIGAFS